MNMSGGRTERPFQCFDCKGYKHRNICIIEYYPMIPDTNSNRKKCYYAPEEFLDKNEAMRFFGVIDIS